VVVAVLAIAARWDGWLHGADRVLIGPFGSLVLPLLAYSVVGTVLGARAFATSVAPLVALGASPGRATLAAVGVSVVACAILGAVLGGAIALVAHGSGDPPSWPDAAASAYAAGLGGAAYAAWFAWGASMAFGGYGRPLLLVVDAIFGAGDGATACFSPRAHLRNLLGGASPMELPQRVSALALVALVVTCALLAGRRAQKLAIRKG
jgi:hypothetical protein